MVNAQSTVEWKYPVLTNVRWTKDRKIELLKVLEECSDVERNDIMWKLDLSESEIFAIKDKFIPKFSLAKKTVSQMWDQVAQLIQQWNHRTDIEDIKWNFSKQEQNVLRVLKLYNWKVVDKQILHNAIEETDTEEKLVDVIICKVRTKLSEDCPYEIETVWWRWYKLIKKESN